MRKKCIQNLLLYAGICWALTSNVTAIFPYANVCAPTATSSYSFVGNVLYK